MAGSALRRLMAEYRRKYHNVQSMSMNRLHLRLLSPPELTLNPPEGIIAGPVSEENFFEWEALIT